MINIKGVKRFCRDDISLIKNYDKAINDKNIVWHCHHINELTFSMKELIKMNMYYNRPAEELIFITPSEHRKLHSIGTKNSFYGKCHTKETKEKLSKSKKGKEPYIKGKPISDFGKKFKEHFGITNYQDHKLYDRELHWYHNHGKCRWE